MYVCRRYLGYIYTRQMKVFELVTDQRLNLVFIQEPVLADVLKRIVERFEIYQIVKLARPEQI